MRDLTWDQALLIINGVCWTSMILSDWVLRAKVRKRERELDERETKLAARETVIECREQNIEALNSAALQATSSAMQIMQDVQGEVDRIAKGAKY